MIRRRPSVPDELFACSNPNRRQWSELQGELLELILEKLDLADHARFASVCSSWRSVSVENPPINKPLYFVLSHNPENLVRRFVASFVPSWKEAKFVGALDGWLVILIDGLKLFLLNKGLNSMIPLPSPPKPEKFSQKLKCFCKAVLSSPPLSPSGGECTVVIKQSYAGVFYCRLGSDKYFTKLFDSGIVVDILFHKGRLYVCQKNTVSIFDHRLREVTRLVLGYGLIRTMISENKLLFVREWPVSFCEQRVFEFVESESRVILVENMNDNLLLLFNWFCSLSITTKEHKEFRRKEFRWSSYDDFSTIVADWSKDPNKANRDDPWPLFFSMFNYSIIKN